AAFWLGVVICVFATACSTKQEIIIADGGNLPPTPASLVIADSPAYDFGTRALSSSTDHLFIVTNKGGTAAGALAASMLSAPFAFKDGTYPGTGGTCGSSLGAASACSIVVTFSPTTTNTATGFLTLSYNDGTTGQMAMVGLTGAATTQA